MNRSVLSLFMGIAVCNMALSQTIQRRPLVADKTTDLVLNMDMATTLFFPSDVNSIVGVPSTITHSNQGRMVVLQATPRSPQQAWMTVLTNGQLYSFRLVSSMQQRGDLAITYESGGEESAQGDGPVKRMTPEDIVAQRLKFDPQIMLSCVTLSKISGAYQKKAPWLYDGYSSREVNYTSSNEWITTTVTMIHRWSKQDITILDGTVQNNTSRNLRFDGRSITVKVGNETHPAKLDTIDAMTPVPSHAMVPITVILQGDVYGGKANNSIYNEYLINLPPAEGMNNLWSFKNGGPIGRPNRIPFPRPTPTPPVPMIQTGNQKEN